MSKETKTKKREFNLLGILAGVVSIIGGFIVNGKGSGGYELDLSYGGDAYTGIQNASAQAANNLIYVCEILKCGFAFLLIAFGIFCIAYSTRKVASSSVCANADASLADSNVPETEAKADPSVVEVGKSEPAEPDDVIEVPKEPVTEEIQE